MKRISDEQLVRVVILMTPQQAQELDTAAKLASLSRSSYIRSRFAEIMKQMDWGEKREVAAA